MTFALQDHLRALCETHAPPGHEAPVRAVIAAAWQDLTDEMHTDALGNLVARKRATRPLADGSPAPTLMVAAHMDEIAMIVTHVQDGLLQVQAMGGIDARLMPAQAVVVLARQTLRGVVASKPPHLLTEDERGKYPKLADLLIDVGLPAAEVAALVQPGDLVVVDAPFTPLLNKRVAAKALDNRACVAAVTVALHALAGLHHAWDVVAVANVQEEVGRRGAGPAAYTLAPQAALVLDVAFAQQPGVSGDDVHPLGKGPVISMGVNFHPVMVDLLRETASAHDIPLGDEVLPADSGTDAWAIQVSGVGVPTGLVNVPIRSMHAPVETASLKDITRAGRLVAHAAAALDGAFEARLAHWGGALDVYTAFAASASSGAALTEQDSD